MLFGNSSLIEHTGGVHIHTVRTVGRNTELVQRVAAPPVQTNRKFCDQRSSYHQAWLGVCKLSLLCACKDQSVVKRVCIPQKCDVLSEQSVTVICCSFLPWVVDFNDFGSGHCKNKISKQNKYYRSCFSVLWDASLLAFVFSFCSKIVAKPCVRCSSLM